MAVQVLTAKEAAKLVPDGCNFATDGYVGAGFAEEIAQEIERRFLETGHPRDLTLLFCAGEGDYKKRGLNHFAHETMIRRAIGGYWGLAPNLGTLAVENKILAYNFPQGVLSHIFRDCAAGKPGTITHVGLNTYVDPRLQGGKINDVTKEDLVRLMEIDGREYLFYQCIPIDFAILKGTFADERGNISIEHRGTKMDMLVIAEACKNCGGKVIVQVERLVKAGTLDPKKVEIPGMLVDAVVLVEDMKNHMMSFATQYNPGFSGECTISDDSFVPMEMGVKKIIARRAAFELKENSIINLGIGTPEFVSSIAMEEGIRDHFILTVDDGIVGGSPQSDADFGLSLNPECIMPHSSLFDFYHGRGLDQAFSGLAQVDAHGNVNVSKFGPKVPGCGGFIDLTQNARQLFFLGTFTAGGLEAEVSGGELHIRKDGRFCKFRNTIEQISFSSEYALKHDLPVLFITERAVLQLTHEGLLLTEIAPGVDLERDILAHMKCRPLVSGNLKRMDARIFREEKMGLGK